MHHALLVEEVQPLGHLLHPVAEVIHQVDVIHLMDD